MRTLNYTPGFCNWGYGKGWFVIPICTYGINEHFLYKVINLIGHLALVAYAKVHILEVVVNCFRYRLRQTVSGSLKHFISLFTILIQHSLGATDEN